MSASDAQSLHDGIAETLKAQPPVVFLDQVGEKLLSEGKIREAPAESGQLSAAESKEAVHRTRIARALLAAAGVVSMQTRNYAKTAETLHG